MATLPRPVDFERLYSYRFRNVDQAQRKEVWAEIARYVTERSLGSPTRLLDQAAGRRDLIDAAPAPERWAVDGVEHIDAGTDRAVKFVVSGIMDAELPEGYFDGIFVSNFLEHLDTQEDVYRFLRRMYEVTRDGGRIAILGPNFRYTARTYFDYADHTVVLTHLAVAEHLHMAGFRVVSNAPRFLPYSFTGRLPASARLTRAYMNLPLVWPILGKQFLVVGER
jgi:SAM-dependent methyltransferase